MVGGVHRRRSEEPGDVHRSGHILDHVINYRFHETRSICLLERTGIIKNLLQLVQESEIILRLFRCLVSMVASHYDFTPVEEPAVLS